MKIKLRETIGEFRVVEILEMSQAEAEKCRFLAKLNGGPLLLKKGLLGSLMLSPNQEGVVEDHVGELILLLMISSLDRLGEDTAELEKRLIEIGAKKIAPVSLN